MIVYLQLQIKLYTQDSVHFYKKVKTKDKIVLELWNFHTQKVWEHIGLCYFAYVFHSPYLQIEYLTVRQLYGCICCCLLSLWLIICTLRRAIACYGNVSCPLGFTFGVLTAAMYFLYNNCVCNKLYIQFAYKTFSCFVFICCQRRIVCLLLFLQIVYLYLYLQNLLQLLFYVCLSLYIQHLNLYLYSCIVLIAWRLCLCCHCR